MTNPKQHNVAELIVEYQSRLKSFIRRRVNNSDDADDILQEVFYQLVKADSLLKPIEQMAAWLYTVARNSIINHRKKKREERYPTLHNNDADPDEEIYQDFADILFDTAETPETEYMRSLVWQELEVALSELPEEQRNVFVLAELKGFSVNEIAEQTGVPVKTVLSRKHYAVLYLREQLKDLYAEIMDGAS